MQHIYQLVNSSHLSLYIILQLSEIMNTLLKGMRIQKQLGISTSQLFLVFLRAVWNDPFPYSHPLIHLTRKYLLKILSLQAL